MQAKPNNPTRVMIHDDQYPVRPQDCRFAAKEVHAPQTVLQVTEESQPRRTAGTRPWFVMRGQNTANDAFIDGDAERPSNLLSDARAAPEGIALLVATIASMSSRDGPLGPGLGLHF